MPTTLAIVIAPRSETLQSPASTAGFGFRGRRCGFKHGELSTEGTANKKKSRFADESSWTRLISSNTGTSTMRQFLQSLCHASYWSYAVYWKIEHENEIVLKWNDAYCHNRKGSVGNIFDDARWYGSDALWSSGWESDMLDGCTGEYSIGQAVADMACVRYPWGKGVIGEVACTGNHYWYFNDAATSKCPDEWALHFIAGIKTILLVPIVPYGVLQLGSMEKVAGCPELVGIIRDKFIAYQNNIDSKPTIGPEFHLDASSSVRLDELSTITINRIKPEQSNSMIQDACLVSGKYGVDILKSSGEADFYVNPADFFEESNQFNQSVNDVEPDMIEDSVARLLSLQEELRGLSHSDYCYVGMFGEQDDENVEAYSARTMATKNNSDHDPSKTLTAFDLDCELHKALGPAFLEHNNDYLWSSSLSGEDVSASSSFMFNRDSTQGTTPLTWDSSGSLATAGEAEHLLEAVVFSTRGTLNESSPKKLNEEMSVPSFGQPGSLNKAQTQSTGTLYTEERKDSHSCVTSALASRITYAPFSAGTIMNTRIEEKQLEKDMQLKKGHKLSKVAKRNRPGENLKPRPRDRQLLQDRFKELRELVPSGSKCSIDGLLDRTIKHMLFLGSVSNQADKLRQLKCQQQGTEKKNVIPSNTKYDQQNGKSWAVELGPELQVCPILVEDLGCPGCMLIEMRCDDHSVFLEIADAIRRLELTILKGVMENRDGGNKWAHFIVEAPRGFHRLDILLPLMQLLQNK